jgi:hypothetical protein
MEVNTRCSICFRFDEDGGHCFLKCKTVRKVWCSAQLEHIRAKLLLYADLFNLFEEVFRLSEQESMKVCILFGWFGMREIKSMLVI